MLPYAPNVIAVRRNSAEVGGGGPKSAQVGGGLTGAQPTDHVLRGVAEKSSIEQKKRPVDDKARP